MKRIKNLESKPKLGDRFSIGGLIIALGVVYGDIGTSPLYVMKSIVAGNGGMGHISDRFILGAVSLVFWTLFIVTTLKYVLVALRADNNGEGGIFALYTLIRNRGKWLIVPAMIGGAFLLADGMLTPSVTVTTAVEGLKGVPINHQILLSTQSEVILVTILILAFLFFIQRFGTELIGKAFGPIMLLWFTYIGIVGLVGMSKDLSILRALNPYYAIQVLFSADNKVGIFILGSVFLATTGAEALYSDMGHVGRKNIYASWPYVNLCLVLNYFGQAVWIYQHNNNAAFAKISDFNPFFEMLPSKLRIFTIIIATLAAIIASQALISGSYTLVSEGIRLHLLPRLHVIYPTNFRGQLYIPTVNAILCLVCLTIVYTFQTSEHMEAAYGLAITVTMLMTTLLLFEFLRKKHVPTILSLGVLLFFGSVEFIFFISSLVKFAHGGWVTILIGAAILSIMYIWQMGDYYRNNNIYRTEDVSLVAYKNQLSSLSKDDRFPLYTVNLVYMTKVHDERYIKKTILYSILDKRPKRAGVYWFVTVNVTDDPYSAGYTVETFGTDYMINVQLYLGFRVEQKVNVYLRQIINDMIAKGELPAQPQQYTTIPDRDVGDFSFVMLQEELSPETEIKGFQKAIIQARLFLQKITVSPATWFGLEYADVITERIPLILGKIPIVKLKRLKQKPEDFSNTL
ncbi:KUP/HAK/KT family potassium transporter [Lactobacillus sp. CC-MHH1034]|uniref:KUP/HAK/KT family potassium transporter n=1 Tax=Agrilactobacillus fermenti TaxID=2586909 RepID=UPI001E565DCF|nr:KUP/HAK/KT family potassium transporter [Agrilactobacillus fermenti]MCD2255405.1 KUP/HAK/KT family potassium transporter [Agrilactobacillus fermenti]